MRSLGREYDPSQWREFTFECVYNLGTLPGPAEAKLLDHRAKGFGSLIVRVGSSLPKPQSDRAGSLIQNTKYVSIPKSAFYRIRNYDEY